MSRSLVRTFYPASNGLLSSCVRCAQQPGDEACTIGKRTLSALHHAVKVVEPLNFVAGKRMDPIDSTLKFAVYNPATGTELCNIGDSGPRDVNRAVENAMEAYQSWSPLSALQRSEFMYKAARKLKECAEEIALMEVVDTGKPIWEAREDVAGCIQTLEYLAGIAPSITGEHIQLSGGSFGYTKREPLGVCSAIGAWNYPFQIAVWKSVPALVSGNTMVFKPSPLTPLSAVRLAEIYTEVGIPPGCFEVVQGAEVTGKSLCEHPSVRKVSFTGSVSTGRKIMASCAKGAEVTGKSLCEHPSVRKVSFTGSVSTGRKIMASCAKGVKPVTLEMGGKSPLIIFDDADKESALKGAMLANFMTQGEVCSNGTRVFVHRSIMEEFCQKLLQRTKRMVLGDPMLSETTIGATISREQAEKVLEYVEIAKKEDEMTKCVFVKHRLYDREYGEGRPVWQNCPLPYKIALGCLPLPS